ncbi:Xaa-Pro dipeptidase [Patescibacteria group bacterium]|nr:MAG: Xaa-Pro dipeptidase [Patescibacteria group bacterium]
MIDFRDKYKDHVDTCIKKTREVLEATSIDSLVLCSGITRTYFSDDQTMPFREHPHFARIVPLKGSDHLLQVTRDRKPLLIRVKKEDFWYADSFVEDTWWAEFFEYKEVISSEDAWNEIVDIKNSAFIGENTKVALANGITLDGINPKNLVELLDYERSIKTLYEVACIRAANKIASLGHIRAKEVFYNGGSERDIHFAYLEGTEQLERELPYETIVAINEHGSTLHYQHKDAYRKNGASLLLDAGASYNGYVSDITRTHTTDKSHPIFREIVSGVELLQKSLVDEITVGKTLKDLHESAHKKIQELLLEHKILIGNIERIQQFALSKVFFPHGVGHFLGIQVHDVGNARANAEHLRTGNKIEVGQVFTVEPGVYFIPTLLAKHRSGDTSALFNWSLIEQLLPYGGVRIEDNVHVSSAGVVNLTREFLS